MFISESLNIVSPEQVVTEVKEVLDGTVCSAVPIISLYDLENAYLTCSSYQLSV